MRIIDADALLEEINSYVFDTANASTRRGEHAAKAHICELIDKQPTAYDLEKVLREVSDYHDLVPAWALREIMEIIKSALNQ